jgi:diguanylate cyclase (GGDEF)-like protein/PAS domain S-box-containing protein
MASTTSSSRFLSLKWRALLLTSLVLVAVTGSFAVYSSFELHEMFNERRALAHRQYMSQVQGLLEQSAKRLQQLGTAVAALPPVAAPLTLEQAELESALSTESKVAQDLEKIMSILELDMGIEVAAFFSSTGTLLLGHGLTQDATRAPRLAMAVQAAIKQEAPVSLYHCGINCIQFAVVPVLGNKRVTGAVLLGVSPADVILDFRHVSGTDIGMLVLTSDDNSAGAPQRWIAPWQASLIAMSNLDRNIALLRHLASLTPDPTRLRDSVVLPHQGRSYDIRLARLNQIESNESAFLVFAEDISDELEKIETAAQRSLALGAAGLIMSETLLMAILWTPMSRLRRTADYLPKLAEAAYEQVRTAIASKWQRRWSRDEVDILDDTAIALSHQLEALHNQVIDRTRDLFERMQELTREKDLIAHILDTAQAIILTQDGKGEIVSVNRCGELLTGYASPALQGKSFLTLLADDTLETGVRMGLAQLTLGKCEHLEEEWDIRCKDNSTLSIVWRHSRLNDQSADGAAPILSIGMDITARKNAELRLAWLADHDPLTRLFNRRRFQKELKQALATAKRSGAGGALLFFDIDQFKYVNDTSGHRAGDLLLDRLGEFLPQLLREVDIVGRIGGDEFAVILPQATEEDAVHVAKKILVHISNTDFVLGDRIHRVSASIGIALFPQDGDNVGDLLAHADTAMYQVKDSGRGGWHLFSTSDASHRRVQERAIWKERVEKALAENLFLLYVQPIVKTRSGDISHYEVLLRMRGDDGSIIPPAQFIDVAERSGLIHAIDRMVLSSALHYQAVLRHRGISVTFAINLSAHAFNNMELLNHLKGLLQETDLDPRQVILEMTETAAISDINAAKVLLAAIQNLGCRFALDDFGAGFSSFYYLRELPMEFVKIDGTFIRSLAENADDQALVMAMGQIATAFGKKAIAEHVENIETLKLLDEYGIDLAQGYYTGRPAPIAEIFGLDSSSAMHTWPAQSVA